MKIPFDSSCTVPFQKLQLSSDSSRTRVPFNLFEKEREREIRFERSFTLRSKRRKIRS